jgi:bacillithiol biosynthesis deacetylase BshB1
MIKLDALFFAAHPDDAELCCGGTIAKLEKIGKKTGIIDLTRGELSTRGNLLKRKRETIAASKVLGIQVRENLNIEDGNIENSYSNRLKIIKAIRRYRPTVIFFPHFHDRHPDHNNVHILVKEASFYSGLNKIKTNNLPPHRPIHNIYYMQTYIFEPNLIIDISDTYKTKIEAINCYGTQFYNEKNKNKSMQTFISSKEFMEYIEARAKFYGFQIGVKYAEAYMSERLIKFNPLSLFAD